MRAPKSPFETNEFPHSCFLGAVTSGHATSECLCPKGVTEIHFTEVTLSFAMLGTQEALSRFPSRLATPSPACLLKHRGSGGSGVPTMSAPTGRPAGPALASGSSVTGEQVTAHRPSCRRLGLGLSAPQVPPLSWRPSEFSSVTLRHLGRPHLSWASCSLLHAAARACVPRVMHDFHSHVTLLPAPCGPRPPLPAHALRLPSVVILCVRQKPWPVRSPRLCCTGSLSGAPPGSRLRGPLPRNPDVTWFLSRSPYGTGPVSDLSRTCPDLSFFNSETIVTGSPLGSLNDNPMKKNT